MKLSGPLGFPGLKRRFQNLRDCLRCISNDPNTSASLEQSVREDVQLVKSSALVRKELAERTRGFIYNLTTGKVEPVS